MGTGLDQKHDLPHHAARLNKNAECWVHPINKISNGYVARSRTKKSREKKQKNKELWHLHRFYWMAFSLTELLLRWFLAKLSVAKLSTGWLAKLLHFAPLKPSLIQIHPCMKTRHYSPQTTNTRKMASCYSLSYCMCISLWPQA